MKVSNPATRVFSHIFILTIMASVEHLRAEIPPNAPGNNVGSPSNAPLPAANNNAANGGDGKSGAPIPVGNPIPGNPTNNLNAGNVGNASNGPTDPNGLNSNNGAEIKSNAGNLPNTSGVNNPINSPAGALNKGGIAQNTNPASNAAGVSNPNNLIGTSATPIGMNGNKLNNGLTTKPGLHNNGVEHHPIGTASKQTMNNQTHNASGRTPKKTGGKNGAQAMTSISHDVLSTFFKIFASIVIPYIANKATNVL